MLIWCRMAVKTSIIVVVTVYGSALSDFDFMNFYYARTCNQKSNKKGVCILQ